MEVPNGDGAGGHPSECDLMESLRPFCVHLRARGRPVPESGALGKLLVPSGFVPAPYPHVPHVGSLLQVHPLPFAGTLDFDLRP